MADTIKKTARLEASFTINLRNYLTPRVRLNHANEVTAHG